MPIEIIICALPNEDKPPVVLKQDGQVRGERKRGERKRGEEERERKRGKEVVLFAALIIDNEGW